MAKKPEIKEIRQLLRYEPGTGKLFWNLRTPDMFSADAAMTAEDRCRWWNTRWGGQEAFTAIATGGYQRGAIWGWQSTAHRVCWAIHHGEWPQGLVDHINGNPTDNRISNLRDVSPAGNSRNSSRNSRNQSGVSGVSREKGRWRARISDGDSWLHLGFFARKSDAVAARRAAEREHGYHENHGRP